MTSKSNRAPLLYYIKLCASFQIHRWIETEVTVRKRSIWVKIGNFFVPCDLQIWRMTLKNNRVPLLCCIIKLCASFHSHQWIQTGVTVRKRPILVKIDDFFSRVTLKFNGWPSKTIGHIFYATSSFVHHFVAIGEFKLFIYTVQKRPIWVKSDDFLSRVTFKFAGYSWKILGHLF